MKTLHLLFILFLLMASNFANAGHLTGGEISYECLGANQYKINLDLYRDCGGIVPEPEQVIQIDGCGFNLTDTLTLSNVSEISNVCPIEMSNTRCNGGSLPGYEMYEYSKTITIANPCEDWVISYSKCCRDGNISMFNNLSTANYYVEALLNNSNGICNSSSYFTSIPVGTYCAQQTFHYNLGALDTDGDSLVYSFIEPLSGNQTPLDYASGFGLQYPFTASDSFKIDSKSGQMTATADGIQTSTVAVLVQEFRNDTLVGQTMRDFNLAFTNCAGDVPEINGIDSSGLFEKRACVGESFCLNLFSEDQDISDSVEISWNASINTATFNSDNALKQNGEFCWTPGISDTGIHYFTAKVRDSACPLSNSSVYAFKVRVKGQYFEVNIDSVKNSRCNNYCDGFIEISTVGGLAPFNYGWSNGSNTQDVLGLCGGTYSVTVTDIGGCEVVEVVEVIDSSIVEVIVIDTFHVSCNSECDGSATVTPNGGTAPYSYLWDDPNAQTDITATGLCDGSYSVTVTDATACAVVVGVQISEPDLLTATITDSSNVSCYGICDGMTTVTPSGGTAPYAYFWNNSTTDSMISGLCAGVYRVTVVDANACEAIDTVEILEPDSLITSITTQNPTCSDSCNGSIDLSVLGGVPPYLYLWDNNETTQDVSLRCAGTFFVWTEDANGCEVVDTVEIQAPDPITTTISTQNPTCSDSCNGSIDLSVSGGVPPYSYTWSNAWTSQDLIPWCVDGSYTVTVTDDNGCEAYDSTEIQSPSPLISNLQIQDAVCDSFSGSLEIQISGGTPPYIPFWSTGANDTFISNLGPFMYYVWVEDVNGCQLADSALVSFNDTSCVWPGDANSDGVVNNADILSLGITYGSNGPLRNNASLIWEGQSAIDWTDTLNGGVNYKHSDCDGSGTINHSDTMAVQLNYNLTHNKWNQNQAGVGAPLYIDLPDSVRTGEIIHAPIICGTQTAQVASLYGLAFSVNFDNSIVESTTSFSFDNSWLGTTGADLLRFSKSLHNQGKFDIAITRTDQVNISQQQGQIGTAHIVIKDDVSGKGNGTVLLDISIDNILAIKNDESVVEINGENRSTVVEVVEVGVREFFDKNSVKIFPNPASGLINIHSEQILESVSLLNIYGKEIMRNEVTSNRFQFYTSNLPAGTYIIRAESAKSSGYFKVVVY